MRTAELEQVVALAKNYNLIPISRTILADTETPIRVFQQFYQEDQSFLLESVEGGVKWAQYSYIGRSPFLMIEAKNGMTKIRTKQGTTTSTSKPIETLQAYLRTYTSPALQGLPRFTGGAVGFFGYDLLQYYEKLQPHLKDDLLMNDMQFMFCDQLIVFDHIKQQIKVIANVHIPYHATDSQIAEAYYETLATIDEIVIRLKQPVNQMLGSHLAINDQVELGDVQSNVTKEQFIQNVETIKEYIRAGDVFQTVLSQRFEIDTEVSPLQVYRVLRILNPSPYMYYLKMNDEIIVGTSPEILVRVEGDRVDTRPIAGTRPRGKSEAEDQALELELLSDEKERAEHLMLVDLGRNDIGRVSEFGSVKCNAWMEIERYSHVMHIVSNVTGKLRQDKNFFDALLSCMPAGTVSGAPKLRAMEIIRELEQEARGAYGGAIGYLGFTGNMDTCITIRTIIFKQGKAYIQAGAGIVWDSVPENEYQETVNKARALITAIRIAEAMTQKDTTKMQPNSPTVKEAVYGYQHY
ncbi:anthranilate synthase component I [Paenibacillus albiflavus]|uniref:Anthranilate synthase component 1 n=1 Tax=Paenibacillus albiflavus TaxID=2545760 RepID=A0A4R4ERY2_9BACL|nr:anthranilate synthase component I [Paenibacillus albiflavus]TCZ81208.1 anthranilate synthase component I [Paenibacillus albiflavus]